MVMTGQFGEERFFIDEEMFGEEGVLVSGMWCLETMRVFF